ncbi:MAG TPA: roadblock/LC7 domain-containing protein [Gammaproteobacteria bacterium]|nr:roadblock/LC7 domain-containing protein [Gammaproteobacteria bacterium]
MQNYQLTDNYYLLPTAAGAFYAVSSQEPDTMRQLMLSLLKQKTTPLVDLGQLAHAIGVKTEQTVLELLHRAQTLSWIQGFKTPKHLPESGMSQIMPKLLAPLSSVQKSLLVDWNGFPIAEYGLDDETATALSALSVDIASVEARHAERLRQTLGVSTQGWAAVDAYGSSRIGAWPLFVGEQRFLLVLQGEPKLNQPEFITLIWLLTERYDQE